MHKPASRPCPTCAGRDVRVIHHQRFALPDGHPLPRSFDVVICADCGLTYADTTGTAADYDRYYSDYSKYADQGTSTGGGGNANDQARLRVTAEAIASVLPERSARIVDIGCANGGLLAAMKDLGYEHLLGIDPSAACVENTRRLFGVPAEQGWLLALPPSAAPAELVIVSHVLEHVLDLREALMRVRSILAPNGLVYVEVPDASRYVDCLAAPFQDFNTEHINHFDAASLESLFTTCGFAMVTVATKTIEAAANVPYPALYGVFRRKSAAEWIGPSRTPAAHASIKRYVDASQAQLNAIEGRLQPYLGQPLIVWGTGQLTLKLLAETSLARASIVAFTDGNPLNHGKRLHGVTIVPPESLASLPTHPIVLGTLLHQEAIRARIRDELKLANPIVTLEPEASRA